MQDSIDRWCLFLLQGLRAELDAKHPEYVAAVQEHRALDAQGLSVPKR